MGTKKKLTIEGSYTGRQGGNVTVSEAEEEVLAYTPRRLSPSAQFGSVALAESLKKATANWSDLTQGWKNLDNRRSSSEYLRALREYREVARVQSRDRVYNQSVQPSTDDGYIVIRVPGNHDLSPKQAHIRADGWFARNVEPQRAHVSSESIRWHYVDTRVSAVPQLRAKVRKVLDDTPVLRVERLLATVLGRLGQHLALNNAAYTLKNLARDPLVRRRLRSYLESSPHPQIRWLIIETLARFDWNEIASYVVDGIKGWDGYKERAALLGAVIAARNNKVPDHLRDALFVSLRKRLQSVDGKALSGDDPEQTELVCNFIDTFRFFATSKDLMFLSRYWEQDCAFPVRLRSIEAVTHVASRFAPSSEAAQFFREKTRSIKQHLESFTRERLVAVENGTLLRKTVALLLSRLGGEAKFVLETARAYPDIQVKATGLLKQAELTLSSYGHDKWLIAQQSNVKFLRNELAKLAHTRAK